MSISLFLLQSLGNSGWKGPPCPHSGHRASTGNLGVPACFSPPRCLSKAAERVGPTGPSGAGCLSPGHQLSLFLNGTQQTLKDTPLVCKITHNKLPLEPKVRKKLVFPHERTHFCVYLAFTVRRMLQSKGTNSFTFLKPPATVPSQCRPNPVSKGICNK